MRRSTLLSGRSPPCFSLTLSAGGRVWRAALPGAFFPAAMHTERCMTLSPIARKVPGSLARKFRPLFLSKRAAILSVELFTRTVLRRSPLLSPAARASVV